MAQNPGIDRQTLTHLVLTSKDLHLLNPQAIIANSANVYRINNLQSFGTALDRLDPVNYSKALDNATKSMPIGMHRAETFSALLKRVETDKPLNTKCLTNLINNYLDTHDDEQASDFVFLSRLIENVQRLSSIEKFEPLMALTNKLAYMYSNSSKVHAFEVAALELPKLPSDKAQELRSSRLLKYHPHLSTPPRGDALPS